jgi:hypothetical protein
MTRKASEPARLATGSSTVNESMARLEELSTRLEATDVEAEVLQVGGAVMTLTFHHRPETRRSRALLANSDVLTDAADAVRRQRAAPSDWLSRASRRLVGADWPDGRAWRFGRLAVFAPPPEYVLAWKCAELEAASPDRARSIRADLRYVARLLDLPTGEDVLSRVDVYFTPRQLAPNLEERLDELLR